MKRKNTGLKILLKSNIEKFIVKGQIIINSAS